MSDSPPRVRLFMSAADELALAAWTRAARRDPDATAVRIALDEQRWLAAVMHEERRRTPREERDAFDARCDRVLARLDPPAVPAPVVMAVPQPLFDLGPKLPTPRGVARRRPLADAGA